mgnify:CR=1 FL=1
MINPLRNIEINHYILHSPRVKEALEGFSIAQISDIHLGRWVKPFHLDQIVNLVNGWGPDVVALTGDYVGYDKRDIDRCVESLAGLAPPSYAVLGNHDHWTDGDRAKAAFKQTDIQLLTNEMVLHGEDDSGIELLEIIGVDDMVTKNHDVERAFADSELDRFALVLNHVPKLAEDCARAGGDLILSGHTHNFQFNIPRFTNRLAETMGVDYFAGPYRIDDAFLYINRGLGSASWPWRIRALPELTRIDLKYGDVPRLELIDTQNFGVDHTWARAIEGRIGQRLAERTRRK